MTRVLAVAALVLATATAARAEPVCAVYWACVSTNGANACVRVDDSDTSWHRVCAGADGYSTCDYNDGYLRCQWVG